MSEGSGNLRVLPGAYVSPCLGVRKHFKSEMLKKQCNKQLQTLHLDSPIVSILYALLMYTNTHTDTHTHFCWLNHLKTTCRHCALECFCINIFSYKIIIMAISTPLKINNSYMSSNIYTKNFPVVPECLLWSFYFFFFLTQDSIKVYALHLAKISL